MTHKLHLTMLTALLLALSTFTGCAWTSVGPGYAGIVVNQSGSQRGVSDFPLKTGRVFYNPITTDVIEYPTFTQTAVWTKNTSEGHPTDESITFTTKDSMVVNADISLSYYQKADRVPEFYVQFHLNDLDAYTHGFLHNITRDKMNELGGGYTVEQIMGDNGPFIKAVRDAVQAEVAPYGTVLSQFGFVGAPRPPETVIASINTKVQATQIALQKQNEVLQAEADAKKRVAQANGEAQAHIAQANGEASANRALTSSITPALIEWRRMELQSNAIAKWNGQQPLVQGSAQGLLLQMPVTH